ncbi:hypothetical protein [Georgenia thermotolerans]|uniref:Uncharacterized protein n=1 Tax=Georgenia thermotolerans TaxID=527326 RepID=A0A7J5USP6_9MICO|nr:hypothetical protein [Georgenia thermotolerans]KAE8764853.1 hypothetical protein GB883_06950 [Georgenia thermotolerans]
MGVRQAVTRAAAEGAHVLLVEVPGWWRTRAAVERAVLARGWRLALTPADADALVVCGAPGAGLRERVESVWHQLPGPRVRVGIVDDDAAACLDRVHAGLLHTAAHRDDARRRPGASDLLAEPGDDGSGHGDMEGHEGHGDHGDMEGHEGHGDMDMGMDMSPGGIPLAGGGEDRDGLEMDVLTVRLGPVLPYWPAGLVLHCSLQGDVITEAHGDVVDEAEHVGTEPDRRARSLDNLVALLALAGWDDAAAQARRARDAALGAEARGEVPLDRLSRRLRRSRLLRWSLRGVAPLKAEAGRHGLPAAVVGDTYDRLLRLLDRATADDARGDGEAAGDRVRAPGPACSPRRLAHLVTGLDLATARLAIASLDIHELAVDRAGHEVSHG